MGYPEGYNQLAQLMYIPILFIWLYDLSFKERLSCHYLTFASTFLMAHFPMTPSSYDLLRQSSTLLCFTLLTMADAGINLRMQIDCSFEKTHMQVYYFLCKFISVYVNWCAFWFQVRKYTPLSAKGVGTHMYIQPWTVFTLMFLKAHWHL